MIAEPLPAGAEAEKPIDRPRAAHTALSTPKFGPEGAAGQCVCAGARRSCPWHADRAEISGITTVIARRSTAHGSGLGTCRWVAGQSIALLHWFRRLRIRWEIRADIHEAFPGLACAIIRRRLRSLSLCPDLFSCLPREPRRRPSVAWRPASGLDLPGRHARRGLRYAWPFDIMFE